MAAHVYMSEISPYWTITRQEATLAAVMPGARVFRDAAADLADRARMLLPTSRTDPTEVVHVASLSVLARSAEDMRAMLAALTARGARLASAEGGEPADVLANWLAARNKS